MAAQERDDAKKRIVRATFILVIVVSTSVEKDIELPTVAMKVHECLDLIVIPQHLHHLESVVDRRVQESVWSIPAPVQVASELAASIIAVHDAVNIQHWHYTKDEVFTKVLALGISQPL